MTGADLVRRRALSNVGAKITRRAREELQLGDNLDSIYGELVHFHRATLEGENIHDRMPPEVRSRRTAQAATIDLSRFDAVLDALGATRPQSGPAPSSYTSAINTTSAPTPQTLQPARKGHPRSHRHQSLISCAFWRRTISGMPAKQAPDGVSEGDAGRAARRGLSTLTIRSADCRKGRDRQWDLAGVTQQLPDPIEPSEWAHLGANSTRTLT